MHKLKNRKQQYLSHNIAPLLKKSNLDPEVLSSFRPVSNLSYLFKIIERVAASRYKLHISTHNLFSSPAICIPLSIQLKLPFYQSTMISFVPLTMVRCPHWCCWTSVQHLTPSTTRYLYQFCRSGSHWLTLCLIGVSPTSTTALSRSAMPIKRLPVSPSTACTPRFGSWAVGVLSLH